MGHIEKDLTEQGIADLVLPLTMSVHGAAASGGVKVSHSSQREGATGGQSHRAGKGKESVGKEIGESAN